MKRILVVCQPYYPDPTSTSQLWTVLFERLAAAPDVELTVLCGFPSGQKPGSGRVSRKETRHGVKIHRCGIRLDHKRTLANRALAYVCFLLHAGWLLMTVPTPDVLFGVTNPPFNAQLLWLASLVRGFRYQFMLQDLYPEGLIDLGGLRRQSMVARLWLAANRSAYRRAARLAVLGRDMICLLHGNYAIDPSRCHYIPHWSPLEHRTPKSLEDSQLYHHLGLTGKFIVQYSGNMGLWHDIDILVRAAEGLREDDRIHFLFIGDGRRRAAAQRLSARLGLRNLTWLDFVPLEQLDDSLACCHVSLVSLRAGLNGVAVPCKLYGILASGRSIIAQVPCDSEVALTVRENACGSVVPPGDLGGLIEAIRAASRDEARVRQEGTRARQAYDNKYLLDHGARAFRRLWDLPDQADAP
jgi:glycosyltransferase involved in cell wall biosynthesis